MHPKTVRYRITHFHAAGVPSGNHGVGAFVTIDPPAGALNGIYDDRQFALEQFHRSSSLDDSAGDEHLTAPTIVLGRQPSLTGLSIAEHCRRDIARPEGCVASLSRRLQRLDLDAQQNFRREAHVEREIQPEVTSIEAAVDVRAAGLDLVHGMRVNALEALDR